MDAVNKPKSLHRERIIGFNGTVLNGLKVHPDDQHLIYPLGCNIIVEDISKDGFGSQTILSKHTDYVSCLAVSPSGKYVASGQVTHMGFKAAILIWDYATKQPLHEMTMHKVKVEALTFSCNEKYLISLGGQDDGSVVVWDVERGEAICGSLAQVESAGKTCCVCASDVSDDIFVTGGENSLRVWNLDVQERKIRPTNVNLGGLKRIVTCIQMVNRRNINFFFCGTTTGDILAVNMNTALQQFLVPVKYKFNFGVTSLAFVKVDDAREKFDFIVGTGDGTLAQCRIKTTMNGNKATLKRNVEWKDHSNTSNCSSLISIALTGAGDQVFVGSCSSNIYKFNYPELSLSFKKTSHSKPVNDVIFPHGASDVIVTCQDEEIRIWQRGTGKELRQTRVPGYMCNAIDVTWDGKSVISAWDDGTIRVYDLYLKEKFTISDAHNKGVTAIVCTSNGKNIVSGGGDGEVRVWRVVESSRGVLEATMREHNNTVSSIKISKDDQKCVSASTDGTCIIWSLSTHMRQTGVQSNTFFQCVVYGENDQVILTSGSDRTIGYWEIHDGSLIRELEGSKDGAIYALDMSPDERYFVSGGDDKMIKVWKYDEGEVTHVGLGHSAPIKKARISSDKEFIVSVDTSGAIFVWKFPTDFDDL